MDTATQIEKRIDSIESFKTIVGKFIARLGDPSLYEFRGEVIDLGEYGKGKCTCDHPVRYMLLIWGPNGEVAPVGCECIKHFQAYNDKLYNSLESARLGLMEALAADERKKTAARQQAERGKIQPVFELAKRKFFAVCKMHQEYISRGQYLPYVMWTMKSNLMKKVGYKTTSGYIKFYTRMTNPIRTPKIAYPEQRRAAGIGEYLRRARDRSKRKTLRTHRKPALMR